MENIYRLLKYNRVFRSHRLKYAALLLADIMNMRYYSIRIDPIFACNIRCKMCYFSDPQWRKEHHGMLDEAKIDRIADVLFPNALQLVVGCVAEPTLCKYYLRILKLGKEYGVPFLGLVSNAQLLKEEDINALISYKLNELTLSTHGVKRETYEDLMRGASYDKFMNLLRAVSACKTRCNSILPELRINYTVNPDNLDELRSFFDVYGDFEIRTLQIRPIIDLGNTSYTKKDMTNYLSGYNNIVKELAIECKKRKITFMANTADPTYKKENPAACLYEEVLRKISPKQVWKTDFLWETESYRDYCKRTKWRWHLFKSIFMSADRFGKNKKTMTYDVDIA